MAITQHISSECGEKAMNTKDNQRARLTKLLMKQAYIRLMHEKQPSKITVKDICSGAEVNRSTFYLHYTQPNDILIELEDEAIQQVSDSLRSIGGSFEAPTDARRYLLGFLRYVQRNDELFRTLLVDNSDPHFRRKLFDFAMAMTGKSFEISMEAKRKNAVYRFIISGSIDLLSEWIRSDYLIPEQAECELLYNLCEGCIHQVEAIT